MNLALDVLRAFCFPFGRNSDTWRVGVVGDIISSASTPMRINNRQFVTLLGSGIVQDKFGQLVRRLALALLVKLAVRTRR